MNTTTTIFIYLFVAIGLVIILLRFNTFLEDRREIKKWEEEIKKHREFLYYKYFKSPIYITKEFEERYLEAYEKWKSDRYN